MRIPVVLLVSLFATVGGAEIRSPDFQHCAKKGVQVARSLSKSNEGDMLVLSECYDGSNEMIIEEYSCQGSDCTFTDMVLRTTENIKNFGGASGTQNKAIAYTTSTHLFIKILGYDPISEPVAGANSISVVEKDEKTFLVTWAGSASPTALSFMLVTFAPGGRTTDEVFKIKDSAHYSDPKVVYVNKHNVFVALVNSEVDGLVFVLIDADTGSLHTSVFGIVNTWGTPGSFDLTLLSDGETIGISRMVVHTTSEGVGRREYHTAAKVTSPTSVNLQFSDHVTDLLESKDSFQPEVAVVPTSSTSFMSVYYSGDSFKFLNAQITAATTAADNTILNVQNAGEFPFTSTNPEMVHFDMANIGIGVLMVYTDGVKMYSIVKNDFHVQSDDDGLEGWAVALIVVGCVVVFVVMAALAFKCCRRSGESEPRATFENNVNEDAVVVKMEPTANRQSGNSSVPALPSGSPL
eukprot:TRINITY_DN670_c8_g1_i1.p1 TRINITY_DN670_c8_g1~~TRINITY_DN670_c8_g1_i1.p1  ORF type:complete len:471 (+),score=84.12 TRINITY_DN670_c8_g1_i1:23-1414(+)